MFRKMPKINIESENLTMRLPQMIDRDEWINLRRKSADFLMPWEPNWQDDHLRLFGLDYGKKLAAAGFKVTESDFINELSPELVDRYALPKGEIVYFCEKV